MRFQTSVCISRGVASIFHGQFKRFCPNVGSFSYHDPLATPMISACFLTEHGGYNQALDAATYKASFPGNCCDTTPLVDITQLDSKDTNHWLCTDETIPQIMMPISI
jgi:hypothetical protein